MGWFPVIDIALDRLLRDIRRAAAQGRREREEIVAEAASRGLGRSAARPLLEQIERQFEGAYQREREFLTLHADVGKSVQEVADLEADFQRRTAALTRSLVSEMVGYARGNTPLQESVRRRISQLSETLTSDMAREFAAVREHAETKANAGRDSPSTKSPVIEFDAFVCHATEDKAEIAEPLARALVAKGLRVWYDKFILTVGDGLRAAIDKGLARSHYGIVILSPSFFEKPWPQMELDALATRQAATGEKVILPIWHKVGVEQVRSFSPILAGHLGVSTKDGLDHVLVELLRVLTDRRVELAVGMPPPAAEVGYRLLDAVGDAGPGSHAVGGASRPQARLDLVAAWEERPQRGSGYWLTIRNSGTGTARGVLLKFQEEFPQSVGVGRAEAGGGWQKTPSFSRPTIEVGPINPGDAAPVGMLRAMCALQRGHATTHACGWTITADDTGAVKGTIEVDLERLNRQHHQ